MMEFISKNKDLLLSIVNSIFGFIRMMFGIERDPEYYEMRK